MIVIDQIRSLESGGIEVGSFLLFCYWVHVLVCLLVQSFNV